MAVAKKSIIIDHGNFDFEKKFEIEINGHELSCIINALNWAKKTNEYKKIVVGGRAFKHWNRSLEFFNKLFDSSIK